MKTEEPAVAEDGAGRVYLGNLPWSVTEDQIKELFAKSGTISNIEWLTHQGKAAQPPLGLVRTQRVVL